MSDAEDKFEDANDDANGGDVSEEEEAEAGSGVDASEDEAPAINGNLSADADASAPLKKRKPRHNLPEHPLRVSDRGNKGMASTTFLSDWLSTHYEPKDDTEGVVASKVYDFYFNECVRRQDAALDYYDFLNASLKVFPTVSKETQVPEGRKTKKQMFTGLAMRPESPLYALVKRKKVKTDDGSKEKKPGLNLKEMEERIVAAVKELKKPGGVGVTKMKRYFGEKHPEYQFEAKAYLLINALDRLTGQGKVELLKGVGACGYYAPIKSEEEIAAEEKAKEEAKAEAEEVKDVDPAENEDAPEGDEDKEKEKTEDGEDSEGEKEEKDFEVEKVLNRKKSKGQWLYLVRWLGFEEPDDTWEPIENLTGAEEILKDCTTEILKAEKKSKADRKKARNAKMREQARKPWEPTKRHVSDHLKFVCTACTDPYTASVTAIKKYIAQHYPEFDVANKTSRFKQVLEKLENNGSITYVTGKGMSGVLALTEEGLKTVGKSGSNLDTMILEGVVAMAEPKGAAMVRIRKYYADHLPHYKTAEQPKRFKKNIEAAVKKGLLFQVSGLGMTGSYQLGDSYTPPPVTVRRIVSHQVMKDDEYSDVEEQEEVEDDDSDNEQVYKPRTATKSGRKVTVASKKQAPINVPKTKAAGTKRKAGGKAAQAKGKYTEDSSEEEQSESEAEAASEVESEEEPPKKRGKQAAAPAKRGKATPARGKATPARGKVAPARGKAAASRGKKAAAAPSPRGGKGGRGGRSSGRTPAKATVKYADSSSGEQESEEESIASDFEDHPPPIQTPKAARGGGGARGKASPRGKPVNKGAKKAAPYIHIAVPVAIGRGGGASGRSARTKQPVYGTPSPEYEEDSDASVEQPKAKKTPAKKTPAKKTPAKMTPAKMTPAKMTPAKLTPAKGGRGAKSPPAKRGRGATKSAPPPPSDSEPESEASDSPAPPPAKGRGRGGAKTPARGAKKASPAKAARGGARGGAAKGGKRKRAASESPSESSD